MQPSEKQIAAAMGVPVASPRITYVRRILTAALSLVEPEPVKQLGGSPEDLRNVLCGVVEILGIEAANQITSYALKHRGTNAFDGSPASPPTPVVDAAREGETDPEVTPTIAEKAILVERERCAKIVRDAADGFRRKSQDLRHSPRDKHFYFSVSSNLAAIADSLSTDAVGKEG